MPYDASRIGITNLPSKASFLVLHGSSPKGSLHISLRVTPKKVIYKHVHAGPPISWCRSAITSIVFYFPAAFSDSSAFSWSKTGLVAFHLLVTLLLLDE